MSTQVFESILEGQMAREAVARLTCCAARTAWHESGPAVSSILRLDH